MQGMVRLAGGLLFGLGAMQAFGVTLSPAAIGGGDIPGSHSIVDFHTWDGNWAPTLTLPGSAAAGATITIHANATYSTNVVLANTDLPLRSITLSRGDRMKFTYDGKAARWITELPEHSTDGSGAVLAGNGANKLARYSMNDGNWVRLVTLPAAAPPGAIMIVQSRATRPSAIARTNVLHDSTMRLEANEKYAYVFHPDLKKWYVVASPVVALGPRQLNDGVLPPVTRPRTELTLPAGTRALALQLPLAAGDRDRIRIASASTDVHTIRNDGIDFAGTLRVGAGDVYEFMWLMEKGRWTMMASPSRMHDARSLAGGQIPDTTAPTTRVQSSDGNWTPSISLPVNARPGDRVVVASTATPSFQVVPGRAPANFSTQPVSTGSTLAFVVDARGRWTVETRTITILNVYADKVVAAYGAQAARARQLESFRLTNEALENSRANFRLRMVGLMQHRDQGATLGDALTRLRSDGVVQNERRRLGADAVYYEGAEDGCGLAWVNAPPSHMVATGSIRCGTTVMRHEFGHNMGLAHGGATGGSTPYAVGYTLIADIMGGNAIPYYSTPSLYDATLGVAMGQPGRIDAVRAMNERSEAVSRYFP